MERAQISADIENYSWLVLLGEDVSVNLYASVT